MSGAKTIVTDGVRGPSLAIVRGAKRGTIVPLVLDVTLIGRVDSSHIELDDPAVSRVHARIERRTDGFYVVDLDSTSGTLVNAVRVLSPRLLNDGDEIAIGDVAFVFALSPQPRSEAA